jgi:diguanylate cyclase (GGDEF)-like protein
MSAELSPEDGQALRQLFLNELADGVRRARDARDRLRHKPDDEKAVVELRLFFHRLAGTAESVGLGLLGHLAGACEGAADLALASGRALDATQSSLLQQVVDDGLTGVTDLLRQEGQSEPTLIARPRPSGEPALVGNLEGEHSRVLVVDDDPFAARFVDNVLRTAGFQSSYCCEPAQAFDVILAEQPDLLILDVVMPQVDGFELCKRVRAHPNLGLTPIIFVTRKGNVEQRVRGLQVGGNDYVAKPFEPQELVARVRSHLQRLAELREMAIRDGLTRCYNNKYFKQRLEQEVVRARRYSAELTLGIVDVDHFKRVNDTFGHPAGDAVLSHLASLLTASVRSTDVVARYGGEEFAFLLVESAMPEAAIITNRLRERIERHEFLVPDLSGTDMAISCTVSAGLAALQPDDSPQVLLARADGALLAAKQGGRNQVRIAA